MQIHLIETANNFTKLREKIWECGWWKLEEEKAKKLIGGIFIFTKSAPSRLSTEGPSGVTGSSRRNPIRAGLFSNSNIIPPAGGSRQTRMAGR